MLFLLSKSDLMSTFLFLSEGDTITVAHNHWKVSSFSKLTLELALEESTTITYGKPDNKLNSNIVEECEELCLRRGSQLTCMVMNFASSSSLSNVEVSNWHFTHTHASNGIHTIHWCYSVSYEIL